MKIGVNVKIDVTKILKDRIFIGKKGKYLSLTTFIDTEKKDLYGNNGFISQTISREEKESGIRVPILGNCNVFFIDEQKQTEQKQTEELPDDDIPF